MNSKYIIGSLIFLMTLFSNFAFSHNQSPSTIRRTMELAYKSLDAVLPKNTLKGERTLRLANTNVQVFTAKKEDGQIVGQVAQLEFQEYIHVVAINNGGDVSAVVRAGSTLSKDEWAGLSFVEEIRKEFSKK